MRSVLLQRYPNLEYIFCWMGLSEGQDRRGFGALPQPVCTFCIGKGRRTSRCDKSRLFCALDARDIMAYLNSATTACSLQEFMDYVVSFFARHPHIDVIYSHRLSVDADNKAIWYWILPEHSNYLMMRWDLIPQETCFWRRSAFEKWGNVDPTFQFAMDYDLFARYSAQRRALLPGRPVSGGVPPGARRREDLATNGTLRGAGRKFNVYGRSTTSAAVGAMPGGKDVFDTAPFCVAQPMFPPKRFCPAQCPASDTITTGFGERDFR